MHKLCFDPAHHKLWSVAACLFLKNLLTKSQAPIKARSKRSGRTFPTPESVFSATKRDRRAIKHSLILSKVQKSSDKSSSKKRRRPSKKLVATLESLANALPDITEQSDAQRRSAGKSSAVKTIKTKPGASKKKAKIVREERERFGKNLAALSQAVSAAAAAPQSEPGAVKDGPATPKNETWEALRRHLQSTVGNTG